MKHVNVLMARACIVAGLAIPLSVTANAESLRGLFLGAGWPGGGVIHQLSTKPEGQPVEPSSAVQMYSFQEGVALARMSQTSDLEGDRNALGPVQLQAGYDFGAVLGFVAFEDSIGRGGAAGGDTSISLGVAVPITPNFQISGEVTQNDGTEPGTPTNNSWSVTAGFRF